MQGEDCELGWAVEAEGQSYGSDTTVDIELEVVEAEITFDELLPHGGKDECSG